EIRVDDAGELRKLIFTELVGTGVPIDLSFLKHRGGVDRANAIDVTKRDLDRLVVGDIHTCDTWHCLFLLQSPSLRTRRTHPAEARDIIPAAACVSDSCRSPAPHPCGG